VSPGNLWDNTCEGPGLSLLAAGTCSADPGRPVGRLVLSLMLQLLVTGTQGDSRAYPPDLSVKLYPFCTPASPL
jgi:hypothetical protein